MTLRDKQALFATHIARLIIWANSQANVRVRVGWFYDPPNSGSQRSDKSLHRSRLAADLILDKWDTEKSQWIYQTKTDAYEFMGRRWKRQHELCEWGGDQDRNDGNHFSLSHGGRW
jgi:hypothetical protein